MLLDGFCCIIRALSYFCVNRVVLKLNLKSYLGKVFAISAVSSCALNSLSSSCASAWWLWESQKSADSTAKQNNSTDVCRETKAQQSNAVPAQDIGVPEHGDSKVVQSVDAFGRQCAVWVWGVVGAIVGAIVLADVTVDIWADHLFNGIKWIKNKIFVHNIDYIKKHGRDPVAREKLGNLLFRAREINCDTFDLMYQKVLSGRVVPDVDNMLIVLKEAEKRLELFNEVRRLVQSDGVNKKILSAAKKAAGCGDFTCDVVSDDNPFLHYSPTVLTKLATGIGMQAFDSLLDGSSGEFGDYIYNTLDKKCYNLQKERNKEKFWSSGFTDFFGDVFNEMRQCGSALSVLYSRQDLKEPLNNVIKSLKERLQKLKLAPASPPENAEEEYLVALRLILFRLSELEKLVFGGVSEQCAFAPGVVSFEGGGVPKNKSVVFVDRLNNEYPDLNRQLDLAVCEIGCLNNGEKRTYIDGVGASCYEKCHKQKTCGKNTRDIKR